MTGGVENAGIDCRAVEDGLLATPGELVEQLTKLAETVQLHDEQIKTIAQVLRMMGRDARGTRGK